MTGSTVHLFYKSCWRSCSTASLIAAVVSRNGEQWLGRAWTLASVRQNGLFPTPERCRPRTKAACFAEQGWLDREPGMSRSAARNVSFVTQGRLLRGPGLAASRTQTSCFVSQDLLLREARPVVSSPKAIGCANHGPLLREPKLFAARARAAWPMNQGWLAPAPRQDVWWARGRLVREPDRLVRDPGGLADGTIDRSCRDCNRGWGRLIVKESKTYTSNVHSERWVCRGEA